MWETPLWGLLIIAWGSGSLGFLLGTVLSLRKQTEQTASALWAEERMRARFRRDVPLRM
jgi:hypothetical protein